MARHPDFVPNAAHGALPVDQEGAALDAHILAAIHALFDPDAVFFADIGARIGSEDERELMLLLELVMRSDRVLRDPDNHRSRAAIVCERVAKPACFSGAAGGIVLGIEIEDDFFAL